MSHIIVGVLAVVAGVLFCFRGYLAMRMVLAVWGGLVGLGLGAAVAAAVTQAPSFSDPVGWGAAIVGAVVVGLLAYTFYVAAVILAMGSVGYALGVGVAAPLAVSPFGQVVAGIVGAVVLAVVALVTNMPSVLLILAAAAGGAGAIVTGVALIVGALPLTSAWVDALSTIMADHWWVNVAYLVLFAAGVVLQLRKRQTAKLRDSYR